MVLLKNEGEQRNLLWGQQFNHKQGFLLWGLKRICRKIEL